MTHLTKTNALCFRGWAIKSWNSRRVIVLLQTHRYNPCDTWRLELVLCVFDLTLDLFSSSPRVSLSLLDRDFALYCRDILDIRAPECDNEGILFFPSPRLEEECNLATSCNFQPSFAKLLHVQESNIFMLWKSCKLSLSLKNLYT